MCISCCNTVGVKNNTRNEQVLLSEEDKDGPAASVKLDVASFVLDNQERERHASLKIRRKDTVIEE